MIWKLTGWPLRLYQLGAVLFGLAFPLSPWIIQVIAFLYILLGITFHTGRKISWTINFRDHESGLHQGLSLFFIGLVSSLIVQILSGIIFN